jgi:hypothetical protein
VGTLIVTLARALFNFTEWKFEVEPGIPPRGFNVTVTDAAQFPDSVRLISHGFISYLAYSATGLMLRVTSERMPEERIIFVASADRER